MKPLIIQHGRGRVIFNEMPAEGCLTADIDGAGVTVFLTPDELRKLSRALWYAAVRIEKVADGTDTY